MHYFPLCDIDRPLCPLEEREPSNHLTALYDSKKLQGEPADDLTRAVWNAAQWSIVYARLDFPV